MDKILDTRTREFSADSCRRRENHAGKPSPAKVIKGRSAFCVRLDSASG